MDFIDLAYINVFAWAELQVPLQCPFFLVDLNILAFNYYKMSSGIYSLLFVIMCLTDITDGRFLFVT